MFSKKEALPKSPLHSLLEKLQSTGKNLNTVIDGTGIGQLRAINPALAEEAQKYKYTWLHAAVAADDNRAATVLYSSNVDVNAKDSRGKTVMQVYIMNVLDQVKSNASNNQLGLCANLLQKGVTLTHEDRTFFLTSSLEEKINVLHCLQMGAAKSHINKAVFSGNPTIRKAGIANAVKGSPEINEKDSMGFTPLHFAVLNLCPSSITQLIAKGADVNAISHAGETPLHCAIYFRKSVPPFCLQMVEALLKSDNGPSINTKDYAGRTVLDIMHVYVKELGLKNIPEVTKTVIELFLRNGALANGTQNNDFAAIGIDPVFANREYQNKVEARARENAIRNAAIIADQQAQRRDLGEVAVSVDSDLREQTLLIEELQEQSTRQAGAIQHLLMENEAMKALMQDIHGLFLSAPQSQREVPRLPSSPHTFFPSDRNNTEMVQVPRLAWEELQSQMASLREEVASLRDEVRANYANGNTP